MVSRLHNPPHGSAFAWYACRLDMAWPPTSLSLRAMTPTVSATFPTSEGIISGGNRFSSRAANTKPRVGCDGSTGRHLWNTVTNSSSNCCSSSLFSRRLSPRRILDSVIQRPSVFMVKKYGPRGRLYIPGNGAATRGDEGDHAERTQENQYEVEQEDMSFYMNLALQQARIAHKEGEVPVGAVLVGPDGHVLSQGYNQTEQSGDPTAHAEMTCIRQASTGSRGWRLLDCTLYVTLEPCPMCAGAILQSRIGTLVYGAKNTLLGADGSWIQIFPCADARESCTDNQVIVQGLEETERSEPRSAATFQQGHGPMARHPFHPNIRVIRGILAGPCSEIMKDFFRERRRQST